MTSTPNVYAALARRLRALPESRRYLACGTLTGHMLYTPGGVVGTCGCTIGMSYPEANALDVSLGCDDILYTFDHPKTLEQRAFRAWFEGLGGDRYALGAVIDANDTFIQEENDTVENCRARYEYMLKWLDEKAGSS